MNLSDLKPAPYNADIRHISEHAKRGLSAAIGEFGDLSGITFNTRTGNLVTGHQRVDRLKAEFGDLDIADGKITLPNGDIFPVRFVDWPLDKERLANVVANNPEIAGTFTVKLPDFIATLPPKPEFSLEKLVATVKVPDSLEKHKDSAKIDVDTNENDLDDLSHELPEDLPNTGAENRTERDGYPVYFMLSREDYQRYRQAAGNDHEAWFLMVLDYAEAGKFKG